MTATKKPAAKKPAAKKPINPKIERIKMVRNLNGEQQEFDAPKDDVSNMLANGWKRA